MDREILEYGEINHPVAEIIFKRIVAECQLITEIKGVPEYLKPSDLIYRCGTEPEVIEAVKHNYEILILHYVKGTMNCKIIFDKLMRLITYDSNKVTADPYGEFIMVYGRR